MVRILAVIFFFITNSLISQSILLNSKKPSQIESKALNEISPLVYSEIEENDILWSKVVYEFVDLNERLNFPLLFPVNDEQNKIGRKSLWRILKEYIVNQIEIDSIGSSLEIYNTEDFSSADKLNASDINDLKHSNSTFRKL